MPQVPVPVRSGRMILSLAWAANGRTCFGITLVILQVMKTAISIRDEIFDAAEKTARELGISRSELYAKAVREFVTRHSAKGVTGRLNEVYSGDRSTPALDGGLAVMQFRSLPTEEWD